MDEQNKKTAELVQAAQPMVEGYLINEKLTMVLKEQQDKDFVELEIIGVTLHLKGKAYRVPSNKTDETLLSIMHLEKVTESFSE